MEYFTAKSAACAEIVRTKSRFIADCAPCATEREALDFLERVRRKYPDSRHHVYAYRLRENNLARYSDDGEPSGTAGLPVLKILETAPLVDAAVVVTRYFGGTLLGKGGLVSAYSDSAKAAVQAAGTVRMLWCVRLTVETPYPFHRAVLAAAQRCFSAVENEEFGECVAVRLLADAESEQRLLELLADATRGEYKLISREQGFFPADSIPSAQ